MKRGDYFPVFSIFVTALNHTISGTIFNTKLSFSTYSRHWGRPRRWEEPRWQCWRPHICRRRHCPPSWQRMCTHSETWRPLSRWCTICQSVHCSCTTSPEVVGFLPLTHTTTSRCRPHESPDLRNSLWFLGCLEELWYKQCWIKLTKLQDIKSISN